jgi:hypothetical protein
MTKIQNNFLKATINKDLDERLTPNGQMTDATNFMVTSEDSSGMGVGKNVFGNTLVSTLNDFGAVVIGSVTDDSNERIFFFAHSSTYDYVYQYNLSNNTVERVLQSTATTGVLNFSLNHRISHIDIFVGVEGDSLIAWTDGFNPPRIVGIERAKTYAINGFDEIEISVMKPSPIFAPSVAQTQISDDDFMSFIADKFLSFAYRYRYDDGHYSAFSSWSPYVFTPGNFEVDLLTSTNTAMQNNSKAFDISFNTGHRSVKDVEIVFKLSNSNNVYSIIKLNKQDEGWGNNTSESFLFNKYKVYKVISEEQYFRSFDNVPLTANTQARIGNRLVYGNYIEGRDIDSKIDFTVDFESSQVNTYDIQSDEIENKVYVSNTTNVVDFWGESDEPVASLGEGISMNYTTNVITFTNMSSASRYFGASILVKKEDTFSSVALICDMYFDGVLENSFTIPSGVIEDEVFHFANPLQAPGTSKEMYFVVRSLEPALYTAKIVCAIEGGGYLSKKGFDTNDYYLVSKQNTINSNTQEGNVVPLSVFDIDMSNFSLTQGSQFSFDFNIYLAYLFNTPLAENYIFTYSVTSTYSSFQDLIDNSNFTQTLEDFFTAIVNNPINQLPSSSVLSFVPATITPNYLGEFITVEMPYRTIEVEEPSGVTLTKIDYILCNYIRVNYSSLTLFTSMHSSRDYEIGVVFLDEEGRKTTVIDAKNNGVYIPAENSDTQNVLKVTTIGTPPTWAKYYKFAVKYNRGKYDVIYSPTMYNDYIHTYVKLVGDNKSKVKEGDYLILKSDLRGPLDSFIKVKVLEAKFYEKDEIKTDSESGFYFKIKNGNFDLETNDNDFLEYLGTRGKYINPYHVYSKDIEYTDGTDVSFSAGNIVRFVSYCNRIAGASQFRNSIDQKYYINQDYTDFREMFEAVIAPSQAYEDYLQGDAELNPKWGSDNLSRTKIGFKPLVNPSSSGNYIRTKTDVYITTSEIPVFETTPLESDSDIYVEVPTTYTITNGQYQFTNHSLTELFNCYCFGNGVESISVRDEMNTSFLNIDYAVNAVSEDVYRQVNRYADLTYSGVYQESTNVNRLNEFNLSLANYKDDLEKKYGPIVRLSSDQTDILVIQEDRVSKVLYGKDVLYNTDATTNLSRIEDVLGQQVIYAGDYGISFHPESFIDYGTNKFFTDTKRGVVLRLNDSNGLEEISKKGMTDYFKKLFRDNTINNIIGSYDSFYDTYVLNIKYNGNQYVTWLYSDENQGFLTKVTYNPDHMIKLNNEFITFKNGAVYLHNRGSYNTFYGTRTASNFKVNISQDPSTRKIFKNISIEGDNAWDIQATTDLQSGYINQADFKKKEGVYYAYIRGNNTVDTSAVSVTGLGTINQITGINLFLSHIPNTISVGDIVYNTSLSPIGTILLIEDNYIVLNTVAGLSVGDFILSSKLASIETSGILGYYMNVSGTLDSTTRSEIYAINSEVSKSFE